MVRRARLGRVPPQPSSSQKGQLREKTTGIIRLASQASMIGSRSLTRKWALCRSSMIGRSAKNVSKETHDNPVQYYDVQRLDSTIE